MAIYINGVKVAGRGASGKSPYQIAVEGGYTGTETEFNAQLVNIGEATKGFDELKSQVETAKDEVTTAVTQAQNDITTTVTQAQNDIAVAKDDIDNAVSEAQSSVALAKTEINTAVTNAKSEIDVKVENALASIPDSENLATKIYVNEAIEEATSSIVTDIWTNDSIEPTNTKLLWIDPNETTGGLKYYNGSSWVHVPVAWS